MTRTKAILLSGTFLLAGLFAGSSAVFAADPVFEEICKNTPEATVCKEQESSPTPECNSIYGECGILTKAAKLLARIVGVVSLVVIIIGGMRYVLASGDPSKINSAKSTIIFAIAGLVIASLAQTIAVFIISRL